jgi:hypothetical protein
VALVAFIAKVTAAAKIEAASAAHDRVNIVHTNPKNIQKSAISLRKIKRSPLAQLHAWEAQYHVSMALPAAIK